MENKKEEYLVFDGLALHRTTDTVKTFCNLHIHLGEEGEFLFVETEADRPACKICFAERFTEKRKKAAFITKAEIIKEPNKPARGVIV